MDQEEVYETQSELTSELESMCDKLTMWQDQVLEVLDYADDLEELRDNMLHVNSLLLNLKYKQVC